MPGIARINDMVTGICSCHTSPIPTGGIIVNGSGDVKVNELGCVKTGAIVVSFCGHVGIIVTGSPTVTANGIGVARIGDIVIGCLTGMVVTGSGDTIVDG